MAQGQSTLSTSSLFPSLAAMLQQSSVTAPESPSLTMNTALDTSDDSQAETTSTTHRAAYLHPPLRRDGLARRSSTGNVNDRPWTEQSKKNAHDDSPLLRRSGLLQPRSYNPPNGFASQLSDYPAAMQNRAQPVLHSQDTIRMKTMELSNMSFSPSSSSGAAVSPPSSSSPPINESLTPSQLLSTSEGAPPAPSVSASPPSAVRSQQSDDATPRMPSQPSGLSLLRQEYESGYNSDSEGSRTPTAPSRSVATTPRVHWTDSYISGPRPTSMASTSPAASRLSPPVIPSPDITETTPLIHRVSSPVSLSAPPDHPRHAIAPKPTSVGVDLSASLMYAMEIVPHILAVSVKSIPAVLLGCLLNILDGVSYGMILFPGTGIFSDLGPMGVSMFFLSTTLAQLVYTCGGSGFAGANGSMMIEVVPFFHILASDIAAQIGENNPKEIIATTLAAYALSSILTGLTFFLLGALKLGVLIGFFPRHILVGCIGGVGAFLIETGFTVSMRIGEGDLGANWETIETMFLSTHNLILWVIPLVLAVLLRVITHKFHHQLIFPVYFLAIPVLFYIVVAAAGFNLWDLRRSGWIFDMGNGEVEPWYKFYSHFDLRAVRFGALWATLPTQFALLFFNILHPPLNVPALSVSLNEDIDTDQELVAHGYSNLLSGLFGTVFYRVGGNTRIAGFLLAIMTGVLLVIGTAPIAFIPVMVVGALIFVLGIDLVKEAVWDTRHRTSRTEYITIVSIIVFMTVWDFVVGVIFGIIASCFFFVVQNSQRNSIRSLHSGETAMSTVRRPSLQRAYLREVSKQTTILTLQGFLFFGTIAHVEDTIRGIIEGPSWQSNPVRFLVLDFTLVAGVDMSSAEAFVRIHRFLSAKSVTLVFCGFSSESAVGKALQSVHVLGSDGVELFLTFNDAMEWTENEYLRVWYVAQKYEVNSTAFALPGRPHRDFDSEEHFLNSLVSSPRRSYIHDVGNRTIANENHQVTGSERPSEPHNTLMKAFGSYGDLDPDLFRPIERYLKRMSVPEGEVLWKQDDPPDGLYIVESGVLRASYKFAEHLRCVEESMVPGTVAGELSALSSLPRNATVVVERAATLWKLSTENLARLEQEEPKLARNFLRLILKAAKIDHDILLSALAARQ
ncbi:hypothetical protein D9615_008236 [Tricholomella constricta]|uniref:Uncharacterized protein n=1 Tax=Tricholomella constricta TaxID=117010 RepID=A0A8H5M068_9AGAR|nr:hypothetical protein D9615_008236 [Tricholomella constricta]